MIFGLFGRREASAAPPPVEPPLRVQAAFAYLEACKEWTDPIEIGDCGLYFARPLDDNQQIVKHLAVDAIGDYIAGRRSFHCAEDRE